MLPLYLYYLIVLHSMAYWQCIMLYVYVPYCRWAVGVFQTIHTVVRYLFRASWHLVNEQQRGTTVQMHVVLINKHFFNCAGWWGGGREGFAVLSKAEGMLVLGVIDFCFTHTNSKVSVMFTTLHNSTQPAFYSHVPTLRILLLRCSQPFCTVHVHIPSSIPLVHYVSV